MKSRTPENRVAALLELGEINPDQAEYVLREIREAVLEEREACAKLCDLDVEGVGFAKWIRARPQP